ncbi:MAG TPA: polysaccharide deacetylase family protein [Acidobacteriota bacterium]|nr:polysaccharide deacetylase family protein [Acidobacteriota bacterium]HQG90061.1 polysaccharide deacetylase family protein [Acidobacteriota bacterium]HQK86409.1 polysaccharide deacetylase family protein [Acidobacteriota bacterium]
MSMIPRIRLAAAAILALAGSVVAAAPAQPADGRRPLLVTVDDLPLTSARLHPDPAERRRITGALLAALARHGITAVGMVTWGNVQSSDDLALLDAWLAAGHELGNHTATHPDLTRVGAAAFVADAESCRVQLAQRLASRGQVPRFFRYPMLREGSTAADWRAVRRYLAETGQRNLPVTLDTQDYAFEEPWVTARRAGDVAAMNRLAEDYQYSLRLSVRDQERRGDRLVGRAAPQILLLHATEVSAAQWDALFAWLTETGHRFAAADEVLIDPAPAEEPEFLATYGCGLWDRLAAVREADVARRDVVQLLERQAEAWNRGDLEAFCSVYAETAAFASPKGLTRGRAEVLARYRQSYPDEAARGRLSFEILEILPVQGREVSLLGDARPGRIHAVSVLARWAIATAAATRSGLTLLVLHHRGDTWVVVQDASM